MKRLRRDLLAYVAVAAVVGGAAWIYDWHSNRPRLEIEQSRFAIDAPPVGQEREITCRICNLTGHDIRVVDP